MDRLEHGHVIKYCTNAYAHSGQIQVAQGILILAFANLKVFL